MVIKIANKKDKIVLIIWGFLLFFLPHTVLLLIAHIVLLLHVGNMTSQTQNILSAASWNLGFSHHVPAFQNQEWIPNTVSQTGII